MTANHKTAHGYGYRYYAGVLLAAAVISVAGNVAAVLVTELPRVVIAVGHGVPPLVAVVAIHMLSTIQADFGGSVRRVDAAAYINRPAPAWSRLRGTARMKARFDLRNVALVGFLLLAVATVVTIALGLSFVALADVAEMMGWRGRLAWTFPVMVDVPAFVATVGLILAHRQSKADQVAEHSTTPVDELSEQVSEHVVELSEHGVSELDEHAVSELDEHAVSELVDHPDEQVVELVELISSPVSEQLVESGSTSPDQARSLSDQWSTAPSEQVDDRWSTALDELSELVDRLDEQVSEPLDERVDEPGVSELDEQRVEQVSELSDEWLAMAERVRATTSVTADAADLARVLELDAGGASRREISEAIGRPRSTVSGWIKAAETEQHRPALTAVNG